MKIVCHVTLLFISSFVKTQIKVRSMGQGEAEHRKYKGLKRGGGQAYDRSND
jgi:hypothetical protein